MVIDLPLRLSVIVCARNGAKTIHRTLESIIKNDPLEIIVVDGKSRDNTINISLKYTNKIFSDEGRGLAYARQMGATNAIAPFIAYIDSDTELPTSTILGRMLDEMLLNDWAAIHSQIIDPRENKNYWERCEDEHWRSMFNLPGERRYLGTIVCIMQRDIVLKEKFDEWFSGAAEDGDFYFRLRENGYFFGVSHEVAFHFHRSSMKEFLNQRIWYGKGNAKMLSKNGDIASLISPLMILGYGLITAIRKKRTYIVPYYVLWAIGLSWGIISGLLHK